MSKVTFSLVGGQPFPVYAQALDSEPDILLLFYSEQTQRNALNIEACVKQKLPHAIVRKIEVDASDLKSSFLTFSAHAQAWLKPEHEITVNLSGGTKPWSMQLLNIFAGKENAKCVFIDQNNYIWDMATYERHKFEHTSISLDDKFALYGVLASQRTSIGDYNESDFDAMGKIERLFRSGWKAMNEIVKAISSDTSQGITTGTYHYAKNPRVAITRNGKNDFECSYLDPHKNERHFAISSPHAASLLLNTGWFELKVAQLLSRWYSSRKVWLNTSINYPGEDKIVNEIDVVVETTNDKLLFVECKTGVHDSTDIDKFNDVIKSYGGLGGKRIFMTFNTMKSLPLAKCNALNIPCFTTAQVMKDPSSVAAFYAALDKYMDTINAR